MYTEATPQSSGDIAKLTSPRLWFRGRTCVMFYYHMYGADMGTLNVHINAITFFTASGNKGYRWLKGIVNVYLWGIYEVKTHFTVTVKSYVSLHYFNYYMSFFTVCMILARAQVT